MLYTDQTTYYDVLDLKPDATSQDIRTAYLRAKAAFNRDSVALYSLVPQEETGSLLDQIETAYQILSHPEKRREYDRLHGLITTEPVSSPFAPEARKPQTQPRTISLFDEDEPNNVVSIDRVPPMDSHAGGHDLLVAPSTDFTTQGATALSPGPLTIEHTRSIPSPAKMVVDANPTRRVADPALADAIAAETEWQGAFLKRVREARQLSIEEVAEFTRIKKTYILAIENENYEQLPAAVYVRGFLAQVAKMLKLPHEKVTNAYMGRFLQAQKPKE